MAFIRLGARTEQALTMEQYADQAFKKNARRALQQASQVLLRNTQYQLRRRKGNGIPSAPGEPPAMQTGALAKSFKRLRVRLRRNYGSSGVTSDDPGAYVLEWGTTVASSGAFKVAGRTGRKLANRFLRGLAPVLGQGVYRIAPRPYLKPASDDSEQQITEVLEAVIP